MTGEAVEIPGAMKGRGAGLTVLFRVCNNTVCDERSLR